MQKKIDIPYGVTLAAIFITGFISASFLVLKPLIVGALIDDYHFNPSQAGFVAGAEMVGVGIAAFISATIGGKWNRRLVIVVGGTLGILGSVVPILISAFMPILFFRFVAGFGSGLMAAIILTILGTTKNPDRTLGFYYFMSYISAALLMPLGIWVVSHLHIQGAYALTALLLFVTYFTAHRIPATVAGLRGDEVSRQPPPFPMTVAVLSLGISVFFWVAMGALWAFVERLGLQSGLTEGEIGNALTVGQLAAIAGALTASLMYARIDKAMFLVMSIVLAMLSISLIGWGSSTYYFKLGVLVMNFSLPLFLAYLGSMMAALDSVGRIISLSVTSQTSGMAIGAALGGVLAGQFGYMAIATMGVVCLIVCMILLTALSVCMRKQLVIL